MGVNVDIHRDLSAGAFHAELSEAERNVKLSIFPDDRCPVKILTDYRLTSARLFDYPNRGK
jgi:hypothetical protein